MGVDPEPMKKTALDVNFELQSLFTLMGIDLVDFKLEFGYDAHGDLYLGDEISPDSMRLWEKNSGMSKDKDIFRKYGSDEALVSAYKDILTGLRQFT
jgi:phosphoribosylaminoimidazole-succinocarboxamide synthase